MTKMKSPLENFLDGRELQRDQLENIFERMLTGQMPESELAAWLIAWRMRGETAAELTAGAATMRRLARPLPLVTNLRPIVDNCGTGGDGSNTFNVSTASAIVAASTGLRLAKHGNRSVSSQCGSADLLFAAGFPESLSADATVELLTKTGFTFFFAPGFHPQLKHVMPVRRALGVRTIFNLLGPLANPLRPDFQLVGVAARSYLRPVAEALQELGVTRALVVHARDGLDEISPDAITDTILVNQLGLQELIVDPEVLGVAAKRGDLAGGDAAHNLGLLERLFAGAGEGLADVVSLNAGALLWTAGTAKSIEEGLDRARRQLHSGAAGEFFQHWLATAQALARASL